MAQQKIDYSDFPEDENQIDYSDFPADESESVMSEPVGLWEKFKTPLTTIGSRTASKITEAIPDSPDPRARFGEGAINFLGGVVDAASAPINAIPALLSGGASLAGGALRTGLGALGRVSSLPTIYSGWEQMRNPEASWSERGLGALESLGGMVGVKGVGPTKSEIAENLLNQIDTAPVIPGNAPKVPEVVQPQITPEIAPQVVSQVTPEIPRPTSLPRELAGAKPRANLGGKIFIPEFESDIDKALYIIAQTNKSKRDADYLNFLTEATGLEPDELMRISAEQKQAVIQQMGAAQVTGDIPIKRMWNPKTKAEVPPQVAAVMPDYSPSSEATARQIFADKGVQLSADMTNKQIIDGARALTSSESIPTPPPALTKPSGPPKIKVKLNQDGTFSPDEFPDLKLKDGKVVGTHSGNPVSIPKEIEHSLWREIINLPRALQASMDLSFPFRQGLALIHTPAWWKSWGPMVKSLGSDKAFNGVIDSIKAHPNFQPEIVTKAGQIVRNADGTAKLGPSFAEKSGLALTDNLTIREHDYMSRFAEKVPGVKPSNRAYTAFANKLRADTFNSLVDDFKKAGIDVTKDEVLAKKLASYVNAASGRGNLGVAERYASELNAAFFSPRLAASRAQMLGKGIASVFDPRVYAMSTPDVRKEYLKSMLALGTAWNTMVGIGQMAGGETTTDPTNSDFGKIKFGNTRLDPGGGFQQFLVLANRIAQQKAIYPESKDSERVVGGTDMNDPTNLSLAWRFGKSKATPLAKVGLDALDASANEAFQFDPADQAARLAMPIIVQDLVEILNDEEAEWSELGTLPFEAVGISGQTYGGDTGQRRVIPRGYLEGLKFPRKN